MRNKILLSICMLGLLVSCNPKVVEEVEDEIEVIEEDQIISNIGVQLTKKAEKELGEWGEYHMIKSILDDYTSITKSSALQGAKTLSDLIKELIESHSIELLEKPDVIIRVNVLYNHALRLNDMLTITSITDEEVENEIARLLQAFSSLNDKINSVFKIDEYNKKYKVKTEQKIMIAPDSKRNDIRLKALKEYEDSSKN